MRASLEVADVFRAAGPAYRAAHAGHLSLHGWHYVIESGQVHVFDAALGAFVPAAEAAHSGTGPYLAYVEPDGQISE